MIINFKLPTRRLTSGSFVLPSYTSFVVFIRIQKDKEEKVVSGKV